MKSAGTRFSGRERGFMSNDSTRLRLNNFKSIFEVFRLDEKAEVNNRFMRSRSKFVFFFGLRHMKVELTFGLGEKAVGATSNSLVASQKAAWILITCRTLFLKD